MRRLIVRIRLFFRTLVGFLLDLPKGVAGLEQKITRLRAQIAALQEAQIATERGALFSQIGRALTAWSKMEECLVIMFAMILHIHPYKGGLILYSILNFNVWLSLINDLFDLDDNYRPYKKRWNKISERARRIKDQRDQLAHHAVRIDPKDGETAVYSPRGDVRQKTLRQKPMTLTEVNVFIDTVLDIANDLQKLISEMDTSPFDTSVRKLLEPEPDHSPKSDSQ
jgi:hypothetical protein